MKRSLATVLCAAALVPASFAIKAGAQAEAQAWLRAHRDAPQQDQLAELKTQNPEAYAIVKALLTKRSLGLLDPHHPSASFAAAPPQDDGAVAQGPAAFEKIAEESGERPRVAPMYAEAPVSHAHHDWLSWKPQQSAMDDEAMVKSVLGAVASLKAGGASLRGAAPAASTEEDDSGSAASLQWTAPTLPPQQPAAAAPAAPPHENSYMKSIGLVAAPAKPAVAENSYLKGLDLDGSSPPASKHHLAAVKEDSTNYLASFSWDDSAPAAPKASTARAAAPVSTPPAAQANPQPVIEEPTAAQAPAAPQAARAPAAPKKTNALLSWLGGGSPAAAPAKKAAATAKPAQTNPYLSDLA